MTQLRILADLDSTEEGSVTSSDTNTTMAP